MFLKLHYKDSGREFLINTNVIAGVEMNGTEEQGCVLTLTLPQWDGERGCDVQKYETVREPFDELTRLLGNVGLMGN